MDDPRLLTIIISHWKVHQELRKLALGGTSSLGNYAGRQVTMGSIDYMTSNRDSRWCLKLSYVLSVGEAAIVMTGTDTSCEVHLRVIRVHRGPNVSDTDRFALAVTS